VLACAREGEDGSLDRRLMEAGAQDAQQRAVESAEHGAEP
jgi:hypothetical protein